MDAIVTERLCKSYGACDAVRDVSLRVPAGTCFGFLGPNGAGKTTVLRTLAGLIRATSGRATVLGGDAWRDGPRLRRDMGYLPGDVRFWDGLTGAQTLELLIAARDSTGAEEARRLAREFELDLRPRVRHYSRGMKQKLGLIQALMHRPRLLLMDEPTTALDPLVRAGVFRELRAVAAGGRTVLFSSHTLSEVEELCDQVAIVREGRLVECERVAALRARALRRVEVRLRAGAAFEAPDGLRAVERHGSLVRGTWSGPLEPLLRWLSGAGVEDVTIAPPDLEDLFMAYYAAGGRTPR